MIWLALGSGLPSAVPALAPAEDRALSGVSTSPTGSRSPSARFSIKNVANGDTRSVTVKPDGFYVVRSLLPGTYEITVSAPGFGDVHATVAISADGKPVANLAMQPMGAAAADHAQAGSSTVNGA